MTNATKLTKQNWGMAVRFIHIPKPPLLCHYRLLISGLIAGAGLEVLRALNKRIPFIQFEPKRRFCALLSEFGHRLQTIQLSETNQFNPQFEEHSKHSATDTRSTVNRLNVLPSSMLAPNFLEATNFYVNFGASYIVNCSDSRISLCFM
jgi:hypothetical protein